MKEIGQNDIMNIYYSTNMTIETAQQGLHQQLKDQVNPWGTIQVSANTEVPTNGLSSVAVVFVSPEPKYAVRNFEIEKVVEPLIDSGYDLVIVNPQASSEGSFLLPKHPDYSSGRWLWPRNFFRSVAGAKAILYPSDLSSIGGISGREYFEYLFESMEMDLDDYEFIESPFGNAGLYVTEGEVMLANETLRDSIEAGDAGFNTLQEAEGIKNVLYVPSKKNHQRRIEGMGVHQAGNDNAEAYRLLEHRAGMNMNDDIDIELNVFRDRDGRYGLVVNSSYWDVFAEELQIGVLNRLAKLNQEIYPSADNDLGFIGNVPLVIVPHEEEPYLVANMIKGLDGSLIVNANGRKTIAQLKQYVEPRLIRPVQLMNAKPGFSYSGNPFGTHVGGSIQCSMNFIYL